MTDRPYLSIGEVLGLLLEEFPDVTISKIRFLESQGLIDPERTPSGYRKFYDGDVERLRVILREQRENFLPLKVIRDRLERGAIEGESGATPPRGIRNVTVLPVGEDSRETAVSRQHPSAQLRLAEPAPAAPREPLVAAEAVTGAPGALAATTAPAAARVADDTANLSAMPVPAEPTGRETYSPAELCALAGITPVQLAEIESFGLISARGNGDYAVYASTDLAVASAAAGFLQRGVEGRHLRAWRQAAERETALFEQLILPQLRQRNPQARQQAIDTLRELSRLGGELRNALVAATLRHHLDP
ncbi:MAG: putative MerR family transcriptional regulator [Ilumatobacteraceae bacterium]|nr:putative MerR family transcriptional regulator [Ilumatobacteraceae bacterium]